MGETETTSKFPIHKSESIACPICHKETVTVRHYITADSEVYNMLMECECPKTATDADLDIARTDIREHVIGGGALYMQVKRGTNSRTPDFPSIQGKIDRARQVLDSLRNEEEDGP